MQLDYSWHSHYSPDRQALQDAIISEHLRTGTAQGRPMAVYLSGPMGAGKSHVIRHLHRERAFRLDSFVSIDPDRIKFMLPEAARLVEQDRLSAATLLHRESTYVSEVIERESLRRQKNLLVDGTLRDTEWYRRHFARIRADFSHYRIVLLSIRAPPEVVYARAAKRAQVTGRVVPKAVLDDAIDKAPKSFEQLAPLADYSAVIDNSAESSPRFLPPVTWEEFKRRFWDEVANDFCVQPTEPLPTPMLLRLA